MKIVLFQLIHGRADATWPCARLAASVPLDALEKYLTEYNPSGENMPSVPRASVTSREKPGAWSLVKVRTSEEAFLTTKRHQAFVHATPPKRKVPPRTESAPPWASSGVAYVTKLSPSLMHGMP